jgi:hypothetical protein
MFVCVAGVQEEAYAALTQERMQVFSHLFYVSP